MSADYAKPDWAVVDYQMYCLDPHVVDRQTNTGLMLRGPAPERIENDSYFNNAIRISSQPLSKHTMKRLRLSLMRKTDHINCVMSRRVRVWFYAPPAISYVEVKHDNI